MAQVVRLPAMGQSMEEGTLLRWFKAEGDSVEKNEPLAEVMTDKANVEVEAPVSGTVLKLLQPVDAIVPIQTPICVIGEPGEDIRSLLSESGAGADSPQTLSDSPALASPTPASSPAREETSSPVTPFSGEIHSTPRARKLAEEHGLSLADLEGKGTGPQGRIIERDVQAYLQNLIDEPVRITPLAQRMAQDAGIEPRELVGSGPGGKIRSEDVRRATEPAESLLPPLEVAASEPAQGSPTPLPGETQKIPLTRLRKIIADNLTKSVQTIPHVTLHTEADVTELVALRTSLLPAMEKRHGVRVTYTDLLVKATAAALLDHPWLNSSFAGDAVFLHGEIHMGIAVAIPEGLVVPVVKNADAKRLSDISRSIRDLASRARENRLKPDEMTGGTFTITNLGGAGIDGFTPIINPPQAAILGVGRIVERPAFGRDGSVQRRSFMTLSLSFDHRVVDGAPAAEFLKTVRELLESPTLILV